MILRYIGTCIIGAAISRDQDFQRGGIQSPQHRQRPAQIHRAILGGDHKGKGCLHLVILNIKIHLLFAGTNGIERGKREVSLQTNDLMRSPKFVRFLLTVITGISW